MSLTMANVSLRHPLRQLDSMIPRRLGGLRFQRSLQRPPLSGWLVQVTNAGAV